MPEPTSNERRPLLLIADSHVRSGKNSFGAFFQMLSWIETTNYDVVFLGDIMELWIGLKGYEEEIHKRFLSWCAAEKKHRKIYFLEGNHEYFVLPGHARYFTKAAHDELRIGGLLLTHGDTLAATRAHLRFRWWCKSRLAWFLLRFMPFAKSCVRLIKRKLERRSRMRKKAFPERALSSWSAEQFQSNAPPNAILAGHFHKQFQIKRKDGTLFAVLPAWMDRGEVALYLPDENKIFFHNWHSMRAPKKCKDTN